MGLRFKKTIKIAEGLNLNLSSSGISFSGKKGGATFTTGSSGTYVGYGLSGTGLSYRKKISSKSITSALSSKITGKDSKKTTTGKLSSFGEMSVDIDDSGNIVVLEDGEIVSDEKRKKKILSLPNISKKANELKEEYNTAFLQEYVKMSNRLLHVHKRANTVFSEEDFKKSYPVISTGILEFPEFGEECPTEDSVREELELEAQEKIKKSIFVNEKKKRKAYVDERLEETFAEKLKGWEERKEEFEKNLPKPEFDLNKEIEPKVLTAAVEGKEEAINEIIDSWLSSVSFDFETSLNYEYDNLTDTVYADLDLPEIEDMSSTEIVKTEKGELKEKQKLQVTVKNEYNIWIHSIMIFFAAGIFNVSPQIHNVIMSGRTQRRDNAGNVKDTYITSVDFKREPFENTDLSKINALDFYYQFENRENLLQGGQLKAIEPYYKQN